MPAPGQILGGKYRLERLVGSGGFASVWAARNVMLDRLVALKILSESHARVPGFLPRFLREAKLASRKIHKVIVAVEDIDQTPEGLVFLVMELLEGKTLADELKGGKSLSLEQSLDIIIPTLEGLTAAHALNVIHRDIKPANIFLTDERTAGPRVRILDLGLAKDLVSDDELTSTDQMVGTPSYLAPEMFLGPQTRKWAPAADVFACGMLTFRMLAGGLPFDRSVVGMPPIEQFLARAEFYQTIGRMPGPAQYVPSIPANIDAVVQKAISLVVDERYKTAGEMLDDLRRAASGKYRVAFESKSSRESDQDYHDQSGVSFGDLADFTGFEDDDSGDFNNSKTRVDTSPYGLEVLPGYTTSPVPEHLKPVAGTTISAQQATNRGEIRGPSTQREQQSLGRWPGTLKPSEQFMATSRTATPPGAAPTPMPVPTQRPTPAPKMTPAPLPAPLPTPTPAPPPASVPAPTPMPMPGQTPMPIGTEERDGLGGVRTTPSAPSFSPLPRPAHDPSSSATNVPVQRDDARAQSSDSVPAQGYGAPQRRIMLVQSSDSVPVQGYGAQAGQQSDSNVGEWGSSDSHHPPSQIAQRGSNSLTQKSGPARIGRSSALLVLAILCLVLLLFAMIVSGIGLSYRMGCIGNRTEPSAVDTLPSPGGSKISAPNETKVKVSEKQPSTGPVLVDFEVISHPSGATVHLGGVEVGTTPYQISFSRSDVVRLLQVQKEGFSPVEQRVSFEKSQHLEFTLQPTEHE